MIRPPPGRLSGPSARAAITVPLIRCGFRAALHVCSETPRCEAEVALRREAAEGTWAEAERAQTENALRDSEEHLRLAMAAARMGT